MSADEKLAMMIIVLGFIGFPLTCWLFCLWVDHSDDYIFRKYREANRKYADWEQRQRRKRK